MDCHACLNRLAAATIQSKSMRWVASHCLTVGPLLRATKPKLNIFATSINVGSTPICKVVQNSLFLRLILLICWKLTTSGTFTWIFSTGKAGTASFSRRICAPVQNSATVRRVSGALRRSKCMVRRRILFS